MKIDTRPDSSKLPWHYISRELTYLHTTLVYEPCSRAPVHITCERVLYIGVQNYTCVDGSY